MANVYPCGLSCDGAGFFGGKKEVDRFHTALDPDDARSLQHALVAAAQRHQGDLADITKYELNVYAPGTNDLIVSGYRYAAWLDEEI